MSEITLTKGQVEIVDAEDHKWLTESKWQAMWNRDTKSFYGRRNVPNGLYQQRTLYMHNAIWVHHNGPIPDGYTVDHADRNSLNNCLSNLRLASHSQQKQNQRLNSRNTSGYRGVIWHRALGKWRAQITVDGKHISLGCYDDKEDAARAYDAAAFLHFGEFAQLNFP